MLTNPPRRPQDNGVVERSQGTAKRWAEPERAESVEQLRSTVAEMDRRQREAYPYANHESRLTAFPGLRHSGLSYEASREESDWSMERVDDLLTRFAAVRQVDKSGTVSIYNRNIYVSKAHAGQSVYVRYDPQERRWLISDDKNHLLIDREAPELDPDRVRGMTVSNRRRRLRSSAAGKLSVEAVR